MLSEEKAAEVFALISKGRKPWTTVRVWFAVTFSTNYDNWAVTADVPALSAKAGVPEAEVRRDPHEPRQVRRQPPRQLARYAPGAPQGAGGRA
jgi:hypothetical protein